MLPTSKPHRNGTPLDFGSHTVRRKPDFAMDWEVFMNH